MKATSIVYQKVYALGNFQNEKIGIEIELSEEDTATDALEKAKAWCDKMHDGNKADNPQRQEQIRLQNIVNNPDDFTGKEVKEAKAKLATIEITEPMDDLPF